MVNVRRVVKAGALDQGDHPCRKREPVSRPAEVRSYGVPPYDRAAGLRLLEMRLNGEAQPGEFVGAWDVSPQECCS